MAPAKPRIPTAWPKKDKSNRTGILNEPTNYSKNQNRLSNVRWPIGQDLGDEGTTEGDGWVNVKLEVLEGEAKGPNQRNLLGGGAELRLKCDKCGQPLHMAAEKDAIEVLEEAGIEYRGDLNPQMSVVAAACANGHITQLWKDMAERLRVVV